VSSLIGVILAGGTGTRMGSLGKDYPKALLPIANEPLIFHHLKFLRELGVGEIFVIIGHRGSDLVDALKNADNFGVRLSFIEQSAPLGSAHAVGLVKRYVKEPFLLLLGDYYFVARNPAGIRDRMLNEKISLLMTKRESNRQLICAACEIHIDSDGRVLGVREKPTTPTSNLKGCGFYALQPDIFDAIAITPRTALRDEYEFSVSLDLYARAGQKLYVAEDTLWDFNFTDPKDLLECNLTWLEEAGRNVLIGNCVHLDPATHLERVVIGDGVRVTASSLTDVVVFPGAEVNGKGQIQRALVTPRGIHFLD
jgi:dTDP-glucose pyrophosphorylase